MNEWINVAVDWLIANPVEVFGAISGLIYIYFSIKQKIWLWPLGIITSATYIYIYFVSKFYADMGLQVYYLVISIYGWHHWLYGSKSDEKDELPVTSVDTKTWLVLALVTAAIWAFLNFILTRYTDSDIAGWDAFTTATSIVATWMLAKKMLEQWLMWIFIDALCVILYFYKELYATVVLFFVYTVLAIIGYIKWKNDYKNQQSPNPAESY